MMMIIIVIIADLLSQQASEHAVSWW